MAQKQISFRVSEQGESTILSKHRDMKGAGSPRQSWGTALLYIGSLDTERSILAYELWQRALQIAQETRKEDDIRDVSLVLSKLDKEKDEYDEILRSYERHTCTQIDVVNRLSNIIYYAIQIYSKDGNLVRFDEQCQNACERAHISMHLAFLLAVAKFRCRGQRAAQHEMKDKMSEYAGMQQILDQYQKALDNANIKC